MSDPNPSEAPGWPTAADIAPAETPPAPQPPSPEPAAPEAPAATATITPPETDRRPDDVRVVQVGLPATAVGVHPVVAELASQQAEHSAWLDGLQERILRIEQHLGLA